MIQVFAFWRARIFCCPSLILDRYRSIKNIAEGLSKLPLHPATDHGHLEAVGYRLRPRGVDETLVSPKLFTCAPAIDRPLAARVCRVPTFWGRATLHGAWACRSTVQPGPAGIEGTLRWLKTSDRARSTRINNEKDDDSFGSVSLNDSHIRRARSRGRRTWKKRPHPHSLSVPNPGTPKSPVSRVLFQLTCLVGQSRPAVERQPLMPRNRAFKRGFFLDQVRELRTKHD